MDFVAWCVACFGSEITLWNKKFELGPKFCPFIPFLFNLGIFSHFLSVSSDRHQRDVFKLPFKYS